MKKIEKFTFWLCVVLSIIIIIVIRPLQDLDEIWNFNVARCITNGLVPYRDISMVSTPLLGFLLAIPIKIFGQQLFVERVVSIIMSVGIFVSVYKILRLIRVREEVSIFSIFILFLIVNQELSMNYNWLSVIFILVIIGLEIKKNKYIKWDKFNTDLMIGIVGGLVVCTKQSTGLFVSLAMLITPFFCTDSKKSYKQSLKETGYRILGIIIPISALVLYLTINGAMGDFFDYAIYGVSTFSNKKVYGELWKSDRYIIKALCICIPILLASSCIANIVNKVKKRTTNTVLYILTVYSIASFFIVFPISDENHFSIAIIPSVILIVYLLKGFITRHIKKDFKYPVEYTKVCTIILILSYTLFIEISNSETLGKISKYRFQNHFDYIYISQFLDNSINEVDSYINEKEKNVYILDASAAVYMIPIDSYNKDYDMFCVGNLGKGGEEKQIERIKSEDALYMILNDEYAINWQNPNRVSEYIKSNLEYIETKGVYDVYENRPQLVENQNDTENIESTGSENNQNEVTGNNQDSTTENNKSEIPENNQIEITEDNTQNNEE